MGRFLRLSNGVPRSFDEAGSTAGGLVTVDTTAGNKTVDSGSTLFYPHPIINTGDTYTINGDFIATNTLTVNGTLTINGTSTIMHVP